MDAALAEIRMFAGNFAPRGWALCKGQLLAITSNQALFSLLGTIYGGDGRTSFALPDLQGRMPIAEGQGPGLSTYQQGQKGGTETYTIAENNMPAHTHEGIINVADGKGDSFGSNGNYLASKAVDADLTPNTTVEVYKTALGATFNNGATLAGAKAQQTGKNQAVNGMPPCMAVNYIICIHGIFPSRN